MASDRTPEEPPPLSGEHPDRATIERRKDAAARAAAELVLDGMTVGLGTGSTVAHLLAALGERARELGHTRCVASSPETARIARELGLVVHDLDDVGELDIAIDGADQVDPDCWLVKGGGGAHTREKIVAAAAARFVVIVSAEKLLSKLRAPVPLEVLRFGAQRTLAAVGNARLREIGDTRTGPAPRAARPPGAPAAAVAAAAAVKAAAVSPDGNLLAWYEGPIEDPRALAARLSATPGVVEHGLFAPELVSEVLIADSAPRRGGGVEVRRRPGGKS